MSSPSDAPKRARQKTGDTPPPHPLSGLHGHMRNSIKDFVSILKGHYYGVEHPADPAVLRSPAGGPALDVPSGATIILIRAGVYAGVLVLKKNREKTSLGAICSRLMVIGSDQNFGMTRPVSFM